MKKLIALIMLLCVCFSLFACRGKENNNVSKTPCQDRLKEYAMTDPTLFKHQYIIYSWTKNNIEKFKNPASVEYTGKAYCFTNSASMSDDAEYYLVEFRADNGFGGKTVSYMKLTINSIQSVDWTPSIPAYYYFDKLWNVGVTNMAKDALEEYISLNY